MLTRLAPLALVLAAAAAAAQPGAPLDLDPLQEPTQGALRLDGTETGVLDLTVSPEARNPVADCPGFLTPGAPNARVVWTGEGPLRFWMRSQVDGVMVVRAPSGEARCSDDADGVQPAVLFENPRPGRYTVWVGSFMRDLRGVAPEATLYAGPPPAPVALMDRDSYTEIALNFEAPSGEDEPMAVTVGGPHAAASLGMPRECAGFFNAAPSVRYSASGAYFLLAESDEVDLAMAVRAPDGTWACNDDYVLENPVVPVTASGEHAVWVGTFRGIARGVAPEATLAALAEAPERVAPPAPPAPPPPPPASQPFSDGSYTPLDLEATGLRLPLAEGDDLATADVSVVGEFANPVQGFACGGALSPAPTATVAFEGDGPLTLTASSAVDLVMVARDGDRWWCSDDASSLDPAIEIAEPGAGVQVWVGVYGLGNEAEAVLTAHRAPLAEVTPTDTEIFEEMIEEPALPYSEAEYAGGLDLDADAPEARIGTTTVRAGGSEFNPLLGVACSGFVSAAPSAQVSAGGTLSFTATSASGEDSFGDEDYTMVIRTPNGRWFCSDDYDGFNPGIEVTDGGDGVYTVWVGTFDEAPEPAEAVLSVREGSLPPPEAP